MHRDDYDKSQRDLQKYIHKPSIRAGLYFLDYYFFQERLQTRSKRGISYIEFLQIEKPGYVKRYLEKYGESDMTLYRVFQLYYGSINQFKPYDAKWIYDKYQPRTVLDPSMGWGGRCFACVMKGIQYIGIDTNKELQEPYEQMLLRLDKQATLIFQDSAIVDYSQYDYDCVFTSLPYYKKEVYSHMPEYVSYKDWVNRFLEPVIRNSYDNMKPGHFILNIPNKIYQSIVEIIGEATEILPYYYKTVKRIKQADYTENIYVWKKIMDW